MTPDHYFSEEPDAPSQRQMVNVTLRGQPWRFLTDTGVFSADRIDRGTELLIRCLRVPTAARILDLGAGYGPLGLVACRLAGPDAKVTLVEVNRRAVALCRHNARLNGILTATVLAADAPPADGESFDLVLSNPPWRAGKEAVHALIAAGLDRLAPGGEGWFVGPKHLGVKSFATWLGEVTGSEVETVERQGGYRVLRVVGGPTGG